ncbi:MAG: hypothetical protein ACREQM_18950 [Candidatus Dormibacteraceae bacterium]
MTVRTMLGIGWSILCGLAGGWLVLMPWALGGQGSGDWTTVTKVSFGTGLGLLLFCLVGLIATGAQIARLLRPERKAADGAAKAEQEADQESLDRALLQLATKLVADLEAPAPAEATSAAAPVASTAGRIPTAPPAPATGPGLAQPGSSTNGDGAPTWRRVEQ